MLASSQPAQKAGAPRVCLVSQREIRKDAAWCSMYEFEDVVCEIDSVERINFTRSSSFSWRSRVVGAMAWRHLPLSTQINPGLAPITIERDYDLFFFPCINPWDLLYLNSISGWKEKCRKKVCYMYEEWPGDVPGHKHLLSLLNDFDAVILGWSSSADAVQKEIRTHCYHLSPAADALRFSPYPLPPARMIDFFSLGRRVEENHKVLLQKAKEIGLFYMYDTLPGNCIKPMNHMEHRDLFASVAKRSRFFLTYPAKVDRFEETRGLSEAGTRFYEGVCSGAVMVGQAPGSATFRSEFDWDNSVISVDGVDNLFALFAHFENHPTAFAELSRRNAVEGLKRHDWVYRWERIAEILKLSPEAGVMDRKARLNRLATNALAEE